MKLLIVYLTILAQVIFSKKGGKWTEVYDTDYVDSGSLRKDQYDYESLENEWETQRKRDKLTKKFLGNTQYDDVPEKIYIERRVEYYDDSDYEVLPNRVEQMVRTPILAVDPPKPTIENLPQPTVLENNDIPIEVIHDMRDENDQEFIEDPDEERYSYMTRFLPGLYSLSISLTDVLLVVLTGLLLFWILKKAYMHLFGPRPPIQPFPYPSPSQLEDGEGEMKKVSLG